MLRWLDEWYDWAHDFTGPFRPTDRLDSAVAAVRRWMGHNEVLTEANALRLDIYVSNYFSLRNLGMPALRCTVIGPRNLGMPNLRGAL